MEEKTLFPLLKNNADSFLVTYSFELQLGHCNLARFKLGSSHGVYNLYEFKNGINDFYDIDCYQTQSLDEIKNYIYVLLLIKETTQNNRVYYKLDGNESKLYINNQCFSQLSEDHMTKLKNLYTSTVRKVHNNVMITENIIE